MQTTLDRRSVLGILVLGMFPSNCHPVRRWRILVTPVILITCTMPAAAVDLEMAEFLRDTDPTIRGMITVSYSHASDSDGPSTEGLRLGYGFLGGKKNDYPWGEFWLTFREDGEYDITAAGLSVVPIAKLSRRFGVGPLFDLGLSRRRQGGRSVYAGLIGVGAEGVVRIGRRWDLVTTAQLTYRTTGDVEFLTRTGFRFHHRKLPVFRRR